MLLRQFFDSTSYTYTYLLASRFGGEAIIIDPVKDQLHQYLKLIGELGLELVHAVDTHTHADHITALGDLRGITGCTTIMGELSKAHCICRRIRGDEVLRVDGMELKALCTPGHTDESLSFVLDPQKPKGVFTGDVLLIRGTGRTDFQGGNPYRSWDSIVNKLFSLPDATPLYPGHDYNGLTASTIGEEKHFNPRVAGKTEAEYVEIMNSLKLPSPKLMDTSISENLACGQSSNLSDRSPLLN